MPVPLPSDEDARLRELSCYGLLDTPPEPAFDRVTRLAARIFQVPVSLISLVDREREWFKSHHGTSVESDSREHAICAYTILEPRTLVVPDTTLDERFRDNFSVVCPGGVRFYAGAPLTTPNGFRVGTLCIVDNQPREFTAADVAVLEDFAQIVMDEMNLRLVSERNLAELERRKRADLSLRATRDELEVRIQQRTTALVEAEARYRGIFENAVEGIYQARPDGGFLSVNPAFARLLGYPSPEALLEALPDPTQAYAHPADRADFARQLAETGIVVNLEVEVRRTDGAHLWLLENAHAVRDHEGRMVRYEGTVTDITARHAAEEALQRAHEEMEDRVHERTAELALLNGDLLAQVTERQHAEEAARRSESKFRTLLENAQDLISIFSPEGVLLYASPSLQNILGYRPDELIGANLFDGHLHPDDGPTALERLARPAGDGSYLRSEVRMRHQNGTWRTLESISSLLPQDFPVVGVVVNSRDITDRLRNEREVEARARQQAAVAELSRLALRKVDLPAFLDRTAEVVTEVLGVDRTGIGEVQPGGERILIQAGVGFPDGVVGHATVENWHAHDPDAHCPLLIPDMRQVLDYSAEPLVGKPAISAASAAIHDGTRLYGTVAVLSTTRRDFTPEEQVFLQTVADLLSTVVESRRHQAVSREVEARYQRIAANTPGMVFQSIRSPDGTGAVPFVSEGCRQIYGLEPAEIRANPEILNDRIHPEDRPRVRALLAASTAALSPVQWDGRIVLPDGQARWVTVRSRPELMPNGDLYRDGVVIDVTELKHAQEAMRSAKDEAERANAAKSEFLSRMSHELRTPLNAILGFGQLLELDELTPLQASSVEQILTGGRHLLDLVNEVLDIARIEAGGVEMTPERISVNDAIAATLRFVQPMADQHRVRLNHRHNSCRGATMLADRVRFSQVMLNLLSNAIKYNHPEGEVRVSCRRHGKDRVRIIVADTGPGLSASEISRLFTPFQRLKAPERGITGTGIGLAISKGLVEVMGGTIGVYSTPGKGCRFYLDLPVPSGEPPAGTDRPTPLANDETDPTVETLPKIKTVLHIEDHAANLSLVERVFETRDDLRLLAETDGRGGLARARAERPDLILLDLHLPDLGGDEVVRRLHAGPRTKGIPVVIISADATPGQIDRLRGLGVRDYVTKPFRIDALLQAIDSALLPTS